MESVWRGFVHVYVYVYVYLCVHVSVCFPAMMPCKSFVRLGFWWLPQCLSGELESNSFIRNSKRFEESGTCCARLNSQIERGVRSKGFFDDFLWSKRILRGHILVCRIGDDTLRFLCCAFVRCVLCLLLVCNVCVGVGVGVSRWFSLSTLLSVCVFKTPTVCTFKRPFLCTCTTPKCVTTCGRGCLYTRRRFGWTHGGLSACHTTHRTHTTDTTCTPTHNITHNITRRQRQRDRERRQRKRDGQEKGHDEMEEKRRQY